MSTHSATETSWTPVALQRVIPGGMRSTIESTPAEKVWTTLRPSIRGMTWRAARTSCADTSMSPWPMRSGMGPEAGKSCRLASSDSVSRGPSGVRSGIQRSGCTLQ